VAGTGPTLASAGPAHLEYLFRGLLGGRRCYAGSQGPALGRNDVHGHAHATRGNATGHQMSTRTTIRDHFCTELRPTEVEDPVWWYDVSPLVSAMRHMLAAPTGSFCSAVASKFLTGA
jgi:hypothetical protein